MTSATPRTYHFGKFHLDLASRRLWYEGEVLAPPLKVFDCIAYLIEHRDRSIGRDELIEAIWGHVHLADNTLDQVIRRARKVLGDSGDNQKMIETVRGFGYQWGAPVEVINGPEEDPAVLEHTDEVVVRNTRPRSRPATMKAALVILALVMAGAGIVGFFWEEADTRVAQVQPLEGGVGATALLLPVVVESDTDHAWARLGLMELITERLRVSGQVMVSSDSVIALLHSADSVPDADVLDSLINATGAGLVLEATASAGVGRWRVSLRSAGSGSQAVAVIGEGHDLLEAARIAADAMAVALGLAPPDAEPESVPGLRLLQQQIEAARLAQQMDVARGLIQDAGPLLRQHPEIRFQQARLDYFSHNLDAAHTAFEALLEEPKADQDSVFRARILNGLAGVHFRRRESGAALGVLEEAVQLVDEERAPAVYSSIWHALGVVAMSQGDLEAAREHMTRARHSYNNAGDLKGLAMLDLNRGVLDAVRERPASALRYFEESADTCAAIRDYANELMGRSNMIKANLALLDLEAAWKLVPRVDELLARTTNPALIAVGELNKVALLEADGQYQAAEDLWRDVLLATQDKQDLRGVWLSARVFLADHHLREGDFSEAVRIAGEVVTSGRGLMAADTLTHAHMTLIRGYLAQQDLASARVAVQELVKWAEGRTTPPPAIFAVLAQAELAAKQHNESAETLFEQALALAEAVDAPLRLLQVAESYVPWLLSRDIPNPERALQVAELVERHSDSHYGAALLELHVYHATGTPSAWHAALTRAQALAGERKIPLALLDAP